MDHPDPADAAPPDPATPGHQEHRMPGWVKGFVIAGVVVAVLVVLALVVGGGSHGPARHLPGGGDTGVETPDGHAPPVDHG